MGDYTPEGLPVLTLDVLTTAVRDFTQRAATDPPQLDAYVLAMFRTIGKTNSLLVQVMTTATERFPKEHQVEVMLSLVHLYELLRRQAEANQLEKMLEQSP